MNDHLATRIATLVDTALEEVRADLERRLAKHRERLESDLQQELRSLEEATAGASAEVAAGESAASSLLPSVRSIEASETQGECLAALLEAAVSGASRVVFLRAVKDGWEGWDGRGFQAERAALRRLRLRMSEGWDLMRRGGFVSLSASDCAVLASRLEESVPRRGVLVPFLLQGRLAGALYADQLEASDRFDIDQLVWLTYVGARVIETQAMRHGPATATLTPAEEAGSGLELWRPQARTPSSEAPEPEGAEPGAPTTEVADPEQTEPVRLHDVAAPLDAEADAAAAEAEEEAPESVSEAEIEEAQVEPEPVSTETEAEPELAPAEREAAPEEAPPEEAKSPDSTIPDTRMPMPEESVTPAGSEAESPAAPETPVGAEASAEAGTETVGTIPISPGQAESGAGVEVRPPDDLEGPGWAFTQHQPGDEDREVLQSEARRLARLLVSEIKLYHEVEVWEGRQQGNIYQLLQDEIDRSRELYETRVDADIRADRDFFQEELVRQLGDGDAAALGMG